MFATEIKELLDQAVNTLVKWDLVAYLQAYPERAIPTREIASSIGRSYREVDKALSELSTSGIVTRQGKEGPACYQFSPTKRWEENIKKFSEGLRDRNTRWLILNYLFESSPTKPF